MARIYGNFGYSIFNGNGYTAHFQELLYDENGAPVDTDWEATTNNYRHHQENTSAENPYLDDPNAFYGNMQDCMGFNVVGEPESGHKYCEY